MKDILFGFQLQSEEEHEDLWFSAFLASHVSDLSLNKISLDSTILCGLIFSYYLV